MKVSGNSIRWSVLRTGKSRPLHDYSDTDVEVLKIDFPDHDFSFLVKINRREEGAFWLGPGFCVGTNQEIGIDEENTGKCVYIRPKLTRIFGEFVGEIEVERIVQWLYSDRFKFVESLYYNSPKFSPSRL